MKAGLQASDDKQLRFRVHRTMLTNLFADGQPAGERCPKNLIQDIAMDLTHRRKALYCF